MRIYFDGIIYSWQKNGGGISRYFSEIIKKCSGVKEIHATLLLSKPFYEVSFKNISIQKIGCYPFLNEKGFLYIKKIFFYINRFFINKYFKNINEGIFHSTYYTTYSNLKIPQVVTVYDMTHEKFPHLFNSLGAKRFIKNKKKSIEKADAIICISEATKKSLIKFCKVDERKISVIHLGISNDFLNKNHSISHQINFDKPYFLFVGSRELYKNFDFFIKTFSKWNKNKDYDIILIGKKLSQKEKYLIQKLNLKNQVHDIGFVSDDILSEYYNKSIAFVFPSLDEGFGLPIVEALASEALVLASDIEVFREIGKEMIIYFDPKDSKSLIDALDNSLKISRIEKNFHTNSEYVKNEFTWEKCFNKTIQVYKKVLNEKNDIKIF